MQSVGSEFWMGGARVNVLPSSQIVFPATRTVIDCSFGQEASIEEVSLGTCLFLCFRSLRRGA